VTSILWSRSSAWGMKFNTKKCQIMSIGSGKSHPTYLHNLCGHVLSSVQIAKYLYAVPVRCTCTLLHLYTVGEFAVQCSTVNV